jgi:hypothetical protein
MYPVSMYIFASDAFTQLSKGVGSVMLGFHLVFHAKNFYFRAFKEGF